jgi:hypothetical protein
LDYVDGSRSLSLVQRDLQAACERRGVDLFLLFEWAFKGRTSFDEADKVNMDDYIHENMVCHGYDGASSSGNLSLTEVVVDWLIHRAVTNLLEE